jgi:3-hydroxybutyryl-CoA dehydrogenase
MGLGIAYVAALRAQVPRVLLCDRSEVQITKSLALMDKLLAKDVKKGRLSEEEAREARGRVEVVSSGIGGLRDVDMVVEVSVPANSNKRYH